MSGIDRQMFVEYVIALAIVFLFKLAFDRWGRLAYEKAWAVIRAKFPKVSERFNPSFYVLAIFVWTALFFAGLLLASENTVARYVFIALYAIVTFPILIFLEVWEHDQSRPAGESVPVVHKKGFYLKTFLAFVAIGLVVFGGIAANNYYQSVYKPRECAKLAEAKDADLRLSLKAAGKELGPTVSSYSGKECYESITYTYKKSDGKGLTHVYSHIKNLRSGEIVSVCPPLDDGVSGAKAACAKYEKDFYRLFLGVE